MITTIIIAGSAIVATNELIGRRYISPAWANGITFTAAVLVFTFAMIGLMEPGALPV